MDILTLSLAAKKALRKLGVNVNTTKVALLPKTTVNTVPSPDFGGMFVSTMSADFAINEGDTINVVFDGVRYLCDVIPADGAYIFGNTFIGGEGTDTGEPFIMSFYPGNLIIVSKTEGEHDVTITKETTTTTPIKPEYLPGVCLPVVELTTALDPEMLYGTILTKEESLALTNAAKSKCAIMGRIAMGDGLTISTMFMYLGMEHPNNPAISAEEGYAAQVPAIGEVTYTKTDIGDDALWKGTVYV